MHAYLTGTLRNLECEPLQVGGTEDHIHVLSGLSRNTSLAELVKNLKTSSSRNFKNRGPRDFAWQSGYGVFSVSQSNKASVIAYIANQEIDHRKMTFQDESDTSGIDPTDLAPLQGTAPGEISSRG